MIIKNLEKYLCRLLVLLLREISKTEDADDGRYIIEECI